MQNNVAKFLLSAIKRLELTLVCAVYQNLFDCLYNVTNLINSTIISYRPAARRWARSCSWCFPRWSCQSKPSWRRTFCKGTRTPWQRWHSAWWQRPTRCWSAWHGRSWCGRCWSPGIEPAAERESRSRGTRPRRYVWEAKTETEMR